MSVYLNVSSSVRSFVRPSVHPIVVLTLMLWAVVAADSEREGVLVSGIIDVLDGRSDLLLEVISDLLEGVQLVGDNSLVGDVLSFV